MDNYMKICMLQVEGRIPVARINGGKMKARETKQTLFSLLYLFKFCLSRMGLRPPFALVNQDVM